MIRVDSLLYENRNSFFNNIKPLLAQSSEKDIER